MNPYKYTTAKSLRKAFWKAHPENEKSDGATDQAKENFEYYKITLCKSGYISIKLQNKAELS